MANRNFANSRIYTGHVMPVWLDCNFVVDSTNGNGLGIRNLKGPYVQNVFMNTSATPGAGNTNPASPNTPVINPNPAAGTIIIQFVDNYSRAFFGGNTLDSPLGSTTATIVAGTAYIIATLGTTTAAQWIAAGVPSGVVTGGPNGLPAIGTAFVAAISETISGTPLVAPASSTGTTIATFETVGDPNQTLSPSGLSSQGFGAYIIIQSRNFSNAVAAPANGSVISLNFLLSNSSIQIAGE